MIPSEITPKLAKLVLLLGSDQDGEVLAAARAIVRTLAASGTDLHALSAALLQPPTPVADHIDWDAAWKKARRAAEQAPPEPPLDPDAPGARCRRRGLPIWGVKKIEPWSRVARHCLDLDWSIPKAAGGKFLSKEERNRLRKFERDAFVSNADGDWIEGIVTRCHVVRDRWRSGARVAA